MRLETIARRWGRALVLLDTEARPKGKLADDIEKAASTYASSPDLRKILGDQGVPAETRSRVWAEVVRKLAVGDAGRKALLLLEKKRRLDHLPQIALVLRRLVDEREGIVRCEVQSAGPMDPPLRAELGSALERMTQKKVMVTWSVDPGLVGGLKVNVGGVTFDGSLTGALQRLALRAGVFAQGGDGVRRHESARG